MTEDSTFVELNQAHQSGGVLRHRSYATDDHLPDSTDGKWSDLGDK